MHRQLQCSQFMIWHWCTPPQLGACCGQVKNTFEVHTGHLGGVWGCVCVSEIMELGIVIFLVWEVFRKWKTWAAVDIVWTIMAKEA